MANVPSRHPPDSQLPQLLLPLTIGTALPAVNKRLLETHLLADLEACQVFGITATTVRQVVEERSHQLLTLYPVLNSFCINELRWQTCPLDHLWRLWLPLALLLANYHQELERPLIQGILGGQGTGKTTLAAILTVILTSLGYRVCRLSLDDLYKTYGDRQTLQQSDPRLRWRGPPGTHDIDLGLTVLQQLRDADRSQSVLIPRFDKSAYQGAGDRTIAEPVCQIDIVLFEGWFVGVRPISGDRFDTAPEPIQTEADRAFARDCNTRLQAYLPLWELLDRLIVLYPQDYRLSQQWRRQAEHQMRASGHAGMTDSEIDQFVMYFWRSLHPELFITPLLTDPHTVDLVIEIHPDHTPHRIYRPLT